jgi:plasmid stability protein
MAMTLRLTEEDAARLRERAAHDGMSMQESAMQAIRAYLDGRDRAGMIDDALGDILSRYPDTLRRLAE